MRRLNGSWDDSWEAHGESTGDDEDPDEVALAEEEPAA